MKAEQFGDITTILGDCMDYMATLPDNAFDLAIVDPPFGINASEMTMGSGKNKKYSKGKKWDNQVPDKKYFDELFRISKDQIIWGGNYFSLPCSKCWIFWDKGINGETSFGDGELAWTSFDRVIRKANIRYKGFLGADDQRIHNTQKPVKLYKWLLHNYAKEGDSIFDSHFGSLSIGIACHDMGFKLTACEKDEDYYKAATKRLREHQQQQKLF